MRHIFERFIETRSCLKVARELNAKGHRTKQYKAIKNGKVTGGKWWNKVYVYRVLTNRKYLGEIVYKGQHYPGEHDAIVDRKTWDQVQRIIAENGHARAKTTRREAKALLRGILRCGHCGTVMGTSVTGKRPKFYRYYRCNHAERNGHGVCPVKSVAAGEIEGAVVEQLRRIFRSPDVSHTKRRGKRYRYYVCNHAERNGYDACPVKSIAAGEIELAVKDRIRVILRSPDMVARTFRQVQAQVGQQRAELAGQKERLEDRLAELKRAIGRLARSDGNDDALAAELGKLNEEYADVRTRLEEVGHAVEALGSAGPGEDDVREALQKLDPLWDELFPAEKERIVKLLVADVVLSPDGLLIRLRLNGLNGLVAELQGDGPAEFGKDGQTVDLRVPMEFKRRGGRKEIVLPREAKTTPNVGPKRPIVVALARAYRWQRMLDSEEVASLQELARRAGVDRSHIGRILRLSALAPHTVEAALADDLPDDVTLKRLVSDLPVEWSAQSATLSVR